MAKTPRTWTGARTPSGLKRVRNARRRHEVLQPRRTAAKTYVAKALTAATQPSDGIDPQQALAEALSALDHAAKAGAIHPNAAARRKSRLTIKINAAVGGAHAGHGGRTAKTTGKAAAQKAAKARIAASKADKAKGAQTAAGKARAALSRTARDTSAASATDRGAPETAAPKKTTATKASGCQGRRPEEDDRDEDRGVEDHGVEDHEGRAEGQEELVRFSRTGGPAVGGRPGFVLSGPEAVRAARRRSCQIRAVLVVRRAGRRAVPDRHDRCSWTTRLN